jgi:hypothetical protein
MTPLPFPSPSLERAFLQSVLYASLFDYPVTLSQLRDGLIGERADEPTLARCYLASALLQATVECAGGYYFPRGRSDLLETRRRRECASRQLLQNSARALAFVRNMPFVRMVALSGSLAHLNAEGGADLDLFVVTRPARVWSVMVTALVVARLMGWRRQLCLNYIVSERALLVGPADLFCANQIVHLQPLDGHEVYRAFLESNRFVERFYPNFQPKAPASAASQRALLFRLAETVLDWTIAPLYERLCRMLYGRYLRRRAHTWRSRDQVRLEAECLKLHTSSHRREVMERFERALETAMERAETDALTLARSSRRRAAR